jgi:exosortase C (VPDSG-CTERM-specific)
LISAYLLSVRRGTADATYHTSFGGTAVCAVIGFGAFVAASWGSELTPNDNLAVLAFTFVCAILAGGFLFLGGRWMRSAAFPMAFLFFLAPMPDGIAWWIERVSVLASADVTAALLKLTGVPFLRDGTIFTLPGIALEIARECSGIRSSWVLFITSLIAAHLFLDSPWRRVVLVALVIPLGVVRNGLRVMVLALLCVHVGPHMIDSPIHYRGGPIFFVLSLGPLFLLLWWLRRSARRATERLHVS